MSVLQRQVSIAEVVQSDDIDTLREYLSSIQQRIEEVESSVVSSVDKGVSNDGNDTKGVYIVGDVGNGDVDIDEIIESEEVIVIEEGVSITDKVIASILNNADKINNTAVTDVKDATKSGKNRLISATESEKDFLNAEKHVNEESLTEEKYIKSDLEKELDAKRLEAEGEKVDIKETKFVKDTTKNTLLRNSLMELSTASAQLTSSSLEEKNAEIDDLTEMMMRCLDNAEIEDFLGLCAKCKENIIGHENGCKALGVLYHVKCFVCQKCKEPLVKKPFYHTDGQTFCESDYLDTLEKCDVCAKHIKERILRAVDKQYHPECFKCQDCTSSLDGVPFTLDTDQKVLCVECYNKKFAYKCAACDKMIITEEGSETYRIIAMDKDFHVACYKCEVCDEKFTNEEGHGCYPLDGRLLCYTHYKTQDK